MGGWVRLLLDWEQLPPRLMEQHCKAASTGSTSTGSRLSLSGTPFKRTAICSDKCAIETQVSVCRALARKTACSTLCMLTFYMGVLVLLKLIVCRVYHHGRRQRKHLQYCQRSGSFTTTNTSFSTNG